MKSSPGSSSFVVDRCLTAAGEGGNWLSKKTGSHSHAAYLHRNDGGSDGRTGGWPRMCSRVRASMKMWRAMRPSVCTASARAGDRATADWIAGELSKQAGFAIRFQPVVLGRQYVVERASAEAAGTSVEATPFWWPPEDKASFHLAAPLARDGDVTGKILLLDLPFDRGAYLGPAHRAAIAEAAARKPAAILLMIGNPADDRFAYNVTQEDAPWPVPVIVVGARRRGCVRACARVRRAGDLRRQGPLRARCRRPQRHRRDRGRPRADHRRLHADDRLVHLRLRARPRHRQFSRAGAHGRRREMAGAFRLHRHRRPRDRPWRHGAVLEARSAGAEGHAGVDSFRLVERLLCLRGRRAHRSARGRALSRAEQIRRRADR